MLDGKLERAKASIFKKDTPPQAPRVTFIFSDTMEPKEKDNQHYVPQFYFRQFSPEAGKKKNDDIKSICMLKRECGTLVKHASIKKQASRSKFYGNKDAEDEVTVFDTRHYSLHAQIIKEETLSKLSSDQIRILRENVMFQRMRTPSARERSSPIVNLINSIVLPQLEENPWSDVPDDIHNQIYRTLGEAFTKRGRQVWQMSRIRDVNKEQDFISDLTMALAINQTNTPIIFSDSPVVLCNPALKQLKNSSITSLHSQGLIILYPINDRLIVILYDAAIYRIKGLNNTVLHITDKRDIDNINKSQMHEAQRFIYFGDYECSEYVHSIWEGERHRLSQPKSELITGPARSVDGQLLNISGYSTLEVPPNFHPRFSFLKQAPSPENIKYYPFRKMIVLRNTALNATRSWR